MNQINLEEFVQKLINIQDIEQRNCRIEEMCLKHDLDKLEVENLFSEKLHDITKQRVRDALKGENKPIQRSLKKNNIVNWLYLFIPDKKECSKLVDIYSMEEQPIEVHNLGQLLSLGETKSKYFVTGLLQPGLYLFVAQAKTGKTLLAYHLSKCCLLGEPFLNRRTKQCKVLIVQNEEALPSAGKKIVNNGLQELQREDPARYEEFVNSDKLIIAKGLDIGADRDKIFKLVDDNDIELVIVDSFRASIAKSGFTEMDIGAASLLYQFQQEVHKRNMLGVVIHHANKSDNNKGKTTSLNGVGGSNAIIGANDGIVKMVLNSEERHNERETLDIFFYLRNDTPCKISAIYNEGEACHWTFDVLNDVTFSDETIELIKMILSALREPYDQWLADDTNVDTKVPGYSISEIEKLTGIPRSVLTPVLNTLEKSDNINRRAIKKVWHYSYPVDGCELWYLVEESEKEEEIIRLQKEMDEMIFSKLLQCKTHDEVKIVRSELQPNERDRIKKNMPPNVKEHITLLGHPPIFKVGDKVKNNGEDTEEVFTVSEVCIKKSNHNKDDGDSRWVYKLENIEEPFDYYQIEKIDHE